MKHDSRSSTLRRSIQAIGSWQPNSNDALKWHCRRLSKHERRWNAWLRILRSPPLTAEMKAHLQDLGRHLPELWASGRLTPAQQKEVLRSLIRRVILTRPTPDTIEARVVWVSGATTSFSVHPPILRGADVSGYERLVERILALGGAGIPGPRNRSPGDSRGLSFCSQCTHSCLAGRGDPTSARTNLASPSSSRPKPRSRDNGPCLG